MSLYAVVMGDGGDNYIIQKNLPALQFNLDRVDSSCWSKEIHHCTCAVNLIAPPFYID